MMLQQVPETKKVLLVDDEPAILEVVTYCLELQGLSVTSASSAHQALGFITEQSSFDLIISDIHMPFMNGMSFIQRISSLLPASEIPLIVVMTGDSDLEQIQLEDQELGSLISGYLSKPFSQGQLSEMVRNMLYTSCESVGQVS